MFYDKTTGFTSSECGFTSSEYGKPVTVADFTSTGSGFASTGCVAYAFKDVTDHLISVADTNRHE